MDDQKRYTDNPASDESRCHIEIAEAVVLVESMPAEKLYGLADTALRVMDILGCDPRTELSIEIASDAYLQDLNRTYRGIDTPTDVLSFEAETLPSEIAEIEPPYLGDLVLAYVYTLHAAEEANHSPNDEFVLLVVHGILHLVGYNHDTPDTQKVMWAKQSEILKILGINITVPDFIHDSE